MLTSMPRSGRSPIARQRLSKLGVVFARLRTQDARHLFTLKRPVDNELACLEFETEVSDRDQMHEAILHMGFYPTVRIVKTRRTAGLGELSLCLDEVEHAGAFLEIEQVIGPGQSGEAVQAELDAFARSLGAGLERTTETYDSLVRAALAAVENSFIASSSVGSLVQALHAVHREHQRDRRMIGQALLAGLVQIAARRDARGQFPADMEVVVAVAVTQALQGVRFHAEDLHHPGHDVVPLVVRRGGSGAAQPGLRTPAVLARTVSRGGSRLESGTRCSSSLRMSSRTA